MPSFRWESGCNLNLHNWILLCRLQRTQSGSRVVKSIREMTVKNHHRDPLLLSCKLLLLLVLGRISKRKSENNHVRTAEKKDQKVLANFLLASTVVFCTTIRDLRHNTYFSRLDNTIITNPWEADRTRKFRRGLIFIIHNEFHTHYTVTNTVWENHPTSLI